MQLFAIIAFFILLMACINFMNLSTAKASRRVTEVGVKKAIGADRRMLISQYLSESFIMTTVAFVLSLVVVYLLLPSFNYITGKELSLALNGSFFLYALAIIAVTSFLAGSYPAFYLSGFNPAIVLKGNFDTSSLGGQFARKGLVLFQFMLSIILIVSVLVVYKQIEFVQTQNLGYDKDNIVYFNKEGALAGNSEAFHNELRKIPGIKAASGIGEKIIGATSSTGGVEWEGKNPDEDVNFTNVVADYGLMETLGMEMKDGRSFAKEYGAEENKIIFNETAIDIMNLDNPVGKRITLLGEEKEIIGVVKDFHFESFYESVKPLFVQFNPEQSFMTMAKIEAGREKQAIASIEQLYRKFNPGFPFEFSFLDEDFQAQYVAEQRVASLSRYFALLAILISCLGLFGLAAFTTERRMKEIGIRKVLGASDVGIFYLLSKDFTKVVLFASVIALPISYFAIRSWLNGFAYRIDLKLWFFIVALLAALIIAWMTVASHALRAAKSDPVECIRT
ncbi:MAG: FtsX-like permease family protein [Bacteroidota bacterium]